MADTSSPQAARPLRILALGGTLFLGPEVVRAALARGHEVTLFHRGRTGASLFPALERLRGDRNGDLSALEGRSFDAVVDLCAYLPAQVRRVRAALGDRVGHYTLVSSVSVYASVGASADPVDESSPLAALADPAVEQVTAQTYGPLKALCEREAEAAWPGRVAAVRPGLIVGPGDPTDRFSYWPARLARGGEVLAPGDGRDEAQCVDVRDLGPWIVRLLEERAVGPFNAVGFDGRVSFADLLEAGARAVGGGATLAWVPAGVLAEHGVSPWHNLPLWIPPEANGHVGNARAIARGLAFRPLEATFADTLAWMRATGRAPAWGTGRVPGLEPGREAAVLAAWRGR